MANAAVFTETGSAYFPDNISKIEACNKAFIDARKKAMSSAGLERGRFMDIEVCTEDSAGTTCNLIQESQSYFEGGYITSANKISENIFGDGVNRQCIVEARFNVEMFKEEHDQTFIFNASLTKNKFFEGETIKVSGEVNEKSYIYLLWFDPLKDEFIKLIPNDYDNEIYLSGPFTLPSVQGSRKYEFVAKLPKDQDLEQFTEFMLILATKKKFDLINTESAQGLYERLNQFGRKNWRKINLGYTILRK